MTKEHDKKCAERVGPEWEGRKQDLQRLWDAYQEGEDEVEDLGSLHDYGLDFCYVGGYTDYNDGEGYWRFQLSTGGPGDEIRFFGSEGGKLGRAEYWFLNWFDGASVDATCDLTRELFQWFADVGSLEATKQREEGR